jgi:hypothetical protein
MVYDNETKKGKANKIILSNKRLISELEEWKDEEYTLKLEFRFDPHQLQDLLGYVSNKRIKSIILD